MKFRCECGHILFGIGHVFKGFEATRSMSMFPDNYIHWDADPVEKEYSVLCSKCGKEWQGETMDELKESMIEAGVL